MSLSDRCLAEGRALIDRGQSLRMVSSSGVGRRGLMAVLAGRLGRLPATDRTPRHARDRDKPKIGQKFRPPITAQRTERPCFQGLCSSAGRIWTDIRDRLPLRRNPLPLLVSNQNGFESIQLELAGLEPATSGCDLGAKRCGTFADLRCFAQPDRCRRLTLGDRLRLFAAARGLM